MDLSSVFCEKNLLIRSWVGFTCITRKDGGQGKIRLVGPVVFAAGVVEGGGGGKAAKNRGVGGSMGVDTTVLASELISGGMNEGEANSFSGGV